MHEPQTSAGRRVWDVIESTSSQLRMGPCGPTGLDYGAVVTFAQLGGELTSFEALLLGEVLPVCEGHILAGLRDREGD